MKNSSWEPLLLVLIFSISSLSFSQTAELNVKQDPRLDSLLNKKIALDRERYANEYYTLQLYYGNLETATETLENAKEAYPNIPVELSFETPNYKVQAGRFKDKILGLKTLDTVKRDFPSAFLLTRKIESLE
ncbi:hypothetical protein OAN99_03165 [Flavobacteriaceae bacterium]|jgi:hypothetical protein|nr:hypothetical protein [Flavobacteriaceae bacterium]CAI8299315.1 MAG: Uncharacterised protein [uncultured Bacteroidetes bacterium]|tara:strand:- start:373 stop:768 length:396 start_codon:yes stop_codon:yes gene_type:complete